MKRKKEGYSLFSILVILICFGFVVISIDSYISKNRKSTEKKEDNIVTSAKKYVNDNRDFLDNYFLEFSEFNLPLEVLKDNKYLNINKNGYIKITKTEDYNYEFFKYENNSIYKTILNENTIVNTGSGLYINKFNNNDIGDLKYIFKGNNINNYIVINSITYRIIGITNSFNLKAIRSEYNSNIKSYGLGENINFLYRNSNLNTVNNLQYLKNNKYFYPGAYYVGFISPDSITINDVIKDEKNNFNITKNKPLYIGYSAFLNVSDLLNSSTNNCEVNDIKDCDSYLKEVIENGLITNNTTIENNEYKIYKLEKEKLIKTSNLKFSSDKEVVFIKGSLEFNKGNGSINDPYIY